MSTVLSRYSLKLIKKSHYEIWVKGLEKDKRMCLLDKDLYFTGTFEQDRLILGDEQRINTIKKVLVDVLVDQQYKISDVELQNLIILTNISVKRIAHGFYLEDEINSIIGDDFEKEKMIARQFFDILQSKFQLDVRDVEVNYFAVTLNSKGDHDNQSYITKELNDFIFDALVTIKEEFNIDLIDNVDLRISLALHCVPLITRIKYDLQLKNELLFHIKQMSPLAFEIGTYFGYLLQKKYNKRINDDEIAFFAIYFNSGLLNVEKTKEVNSVLVISSVKRSESFLLEQVLRQWFPNDVGKIDFLTMHEFSEVHLDLYNIILTTEKNELYEKGVALYISSFPNKRDYYRLKVYIEGFKSIDDVTEMFKEELFIKGKFTSRHEILEVMSKRAEHEFDIENLYEEVMIREELGSTFFGNYVAIPHPMHAVSNDSFISVALLDKPIEWDEDKNLVRMVLLVCVEKNNAQAFKIWSYVSRMISDRTFLDGVISELSYDNFINVLQKSLRDWFSELR
ncbi:BglG family transcriptional antiterminator [Breznakia blatticola]|uniref:BglG family transcriptional antiterminator n=1 Tax=Breznakia blatticola TaxID=1754012 RepID=A0A4R8A4H7_9FIRM|nr:BglG family transcriptional antiterminator [Breznakia blatticola]